MMDAKKQTIVKNFLQDRLRDCYDFRDAQLDVLKGAKVDILRYVKALRDFNKMGKVKDLSIAAEIANI